MNCKIDDAQMEVVFLVKKDEWNQHKVLEEKSRKNDTENCVTLADLFLVISILNYISYDGLVFEGNWEKMKIETKTPREEIFDVQ